MSRFIQQRAGNVIYTTEGKLVFNDEHEAQFFVDTVARYVRGRWQLRLLIRLWRDGSIKASAYWHLGGRAVRYGISYQQRLDALMWRLGASFVPGPRGGKWRGYYVWRWQDAMEQTQKQTQTNNN
jgi:hypothetical protein